MTQTPFRAYALGQLLELWQQVMPGDAPDEARLADIALLNPAFRPEGFILLWRGPRLIGFALALASQADPSTPHLRRGWITGLGVAADERRAGHGTRLLEACLRFLADAGCSAAELGGNGERYLVPGCDPVAYPAFRKLLQRRGFQRTGCTQAMERDLRGAEDAGGPADAALYDYRQPDLGEIPELLQVISGFSESWAGLVRSYLGRRSDAANLWVACGRDGIVGFAGSDLFPGCAGRFGPIGVITAAGGHGVGARLLRLSLASMARRGDRSAWFLWAPEGVAGRRMYASAGFRISRQFEFFRRDLQAPETSRPGTEQES